MKRNGPGAVYGVVILLVFMTYIIKTQEGKIAAGIRKPSSAVSSLNVVKF